MTDFTPRRILTLQPSATAILGCLGLEDLIVGCTKHCLEVWPGIAARHPRIVTDSWAAQADEIRGAEPDLVIGAVPYQLEAVAEILKAGIRFLGLAPRTLGDIYVDIGTIAGVVGEAARGTKVVEDMQRGLSQVRERTSGLRPVRLHCEEWGNPIILSQPWVAELTELAGGKFIGEPGARTTADAVWAADPEVMVLAWCGAGDRIPLEKVVEERAWHQMKAVRTKQVYAIHDVLLTTPAPTLVEGAKALAAVLHPGSVKTGRPPRRIS